MTDDTKAKVTSVANVKKQCKQYYYFQLNKRKYHSGNLGACMFRCSLGLCRKSHSCGLLTCGSQTLKQIQAREGGDVNYARHSVTGAAAPEGERQRHRRGSAGRGSGEYAMDDTV